MRRLLLICLLFISFNTTAQVNLLGKSKSEIKQVVTNVFTETKYYIKYQYDTNVLALMYFNVNEICTRIDYYYMKSIPQDVINNIKNNYDYTPYGSGWVDFNKNISLEIQQGDVNALVIYRKLF